MKSPEIFDKFYNAHWFLTGYSCRNFSELLREGGCESISEFIGVMVEDVNIMIFDSEQFDTAAHYYANKLINNDVWREKMYKKFYVYAKRYFTACERLQKITPSKLSGKQLVSVFKKITPLQEQVRILGVMLNGLVLDGRSHLSNQFRTELKDYVTEDENFDKHWSFLTQVTKLSLRQKKDLAIAKLVAMHPKDVDKKLEKIHKNYRWLDYMYYGPPASLTQYRTEMAEAINYNANLDLETKLKKLKKEQDVLMKKLYFNKRARFLVSLAQTVLWQKGYRKDVEYHGFYSYEPFLREIAKRKGVSDWKDLLYMFPWEMKDYLLKDNPDNNELRTRRKFSCLIVSQKGIKILTGDKARKYYADLGLEKSLTTLTETKGQCAFAGKAKGEVKLIFVPSDMAKMKQGDILVSQATSPDLISAMKNAAAIVTNTGGLICHAAITSRELKIPCVVGTKNATQIFKDGDLVEVDAESGVVRRIKSLRQ